MKAQIVKCEDALAKDVVGSIKLVQRKKRRKKISIGKWITSY